MSEQAFVVAIVGAECTGKSTLARQMQAALTARGTACVMVPEELRLFSARMGRTPRADEQQGIAHAQTSAIAQAAQRHPVVIADTTALMTAVYSEQVFGDDSLVASSVHAHRAAGLTLLAATDLPWQGDAHQRDGPAARQAVDHLLRQVLDRSGVAYAVITGTGVARLHAAMAALNRARAEPASADAPRWRYRCRRCERFACAAPDHAEAASQASATSTGVGNDLQAVPGAPDTGGDR